MLSNFLNDEINNHKKSLDTLLKDTNEINLIATKINNALQNDNSILICGNGGSAADAQHFSAELLCRFNKERKSYPSICLSNDPVLITAIGNDYGFKNIFSRQIEGLGKPEDILFVISTSGNSENIIEAIKTAKSKKITSIGLLGKGGGKAKEMLDHKVVIDNYTTSRIQELHILIIHIICEYIDQQSDYL